MEASNFFDQHRSDLTACVIQHAQSVWSGKIEQGTFEYQSRAVEIINLWLYINKAESHSWKPNPELQDIQSIYEDRDHLWKLNFEMKINNRTTWVVSFRLRYEYCHSACLWYSQFVQMSYSIW